MPYKKKTYYVLDYVSYWNQKGAYGQERIARMKKRKEARYLQCKTKKEKRRDYCPCCGRGMYDDW